MLKSLKKIRVYYILLISALVFTSSASSASAYSFVDGIGRCFSKDSKGATDCTPCDLINIMVTIGKFVMGLAGSIALLMFIYGGALWLTSGGNKDRIGKGKNIFIQSTIGLAIIIFAYVIISGIVALVSGGELGKWETVCP